MILLASIGITMILMHGSIFKLPRRLLGKIKILKKLLSCALCLGFWVGLALASAKYYIDGNLLELIYIPFASASLNWLFDSLMDFLQINTLSVCNKVENKNKKVFQDFTKPNL